MTKKERFIQFIKFCFWGVLTTLINLGVYALCRLVKIPVTVSTVIAWIVCVAFAFFTNKRYVFNSKDKTHKTIIKECLLFYSSRLFSGAMDVLFMFLTVNVFNLPELWCKIGDEIFVSVLNYLLSIIIVFRENKKNSTITED